MADNTELAKRVYEDLCAGLDTQNWKYDRHDDDLVVTMSMRGEDLPVEMILRVNENAQVVSVFSVLPFTVKEDKLTEMALAVCVANKGMINGCFELDLNKGLIVFRLCSTYRGSLLGSEAYVYMVGVAAGTVDRYNDRFLMLNKGMIDLKKFIEQEN